MSDDGTVLVTPLTEPPVLGGEVVFLELSGCPAPLALSKADFARLRRMLGGDPLNRRVVVSLADGGRLRIKAERS